VAGGRRAVFLDRDGVLNRAVVRDGRPYPPASVEEMEIPPGTAEALRELKRLGYLLVVVTNQPDVSRGKQTREAVEAIHARMGAELPLDVFRTCYHDDKEDCPCRKPKPGLLTMAAADLGIDLAASFMVGDRWRDVDAGAAAGCRTVWLDMQYRERGPSQPADARVADLWEAVRYIARISEEPGMQTNIMAEPTAKPVHELKVKLFADGAEKASMLELYAQPHIQGFTTNPTLMRKAGITDYGAFARDIVAAIPDRPISLEVFADDFAEMERQGRMIATWGDNVYVKIPVTNTKREPAYELVRRLSHEGVKLNVTAILTMEQTAAVVDALAGGAPSNVSIFAGRIADTGRDPVPMMAEAVRLLQPHPQMELIWASPRELLNVFQADAIGCHIITATPDILKKLALVGKDLAEYSLETVKMFYDDASKSGFRL
jgi:transaldolase